VGDRLASISPSPVLGERFECVRLDADCTYVAVELGVIHPGEVLRPRPMESGQKSSQRPDPKAERQKLRHVVSSMQGEDSPP